MEKLEPRQMLLKTFVGKKVNEIIDYLNAMEEMANKKESAGNDKNEEEEKNME